MKKFINYVDDAIVESLSGLASAHADLLRVEFDPTFVCRRVPKRDAVAVVSGGGSGHEPLHTGYVGAGMLDAACPGQVFTSPTPDQWMAAAHSVNAGRGVLFIVKNYAGDRAQLPDGERHAGRPRPPDGGGRRRRRDRPFDARQRPPRRGGHDDRREDGRRRGRGRRRPVRLQGAGRPHQRRHRLDGRGLQQLHRAGIGRGHLRDRRAGDGARRRHPRRARARSACPSRRRRDRRPAARPDPQGPCARARPRGAAASSTAWAARR